MKNPRAALTPKPSPEPRVLKLKHHPREVGGSPSKEFNHVLLKQVIGSLWTAHAADKRSRGRAFDAAAAALAGIKPKDELEGHDVGTTGRRPQRRNGVLSARHDW